VTAIVTEAVGAPAPWLADAGPIPLPGSSAFRFRHSLAGHPLLSRNAMVNLARELPDSMTRCLPAKRALLMSEKQPAAPAVCMTTATAAEDLEANGFALRLYHLELLPGYRSLIADLAAEVMPLAGEADQPRTGEGSMFVAPPRAVTPVHCDRPHNFLFQVHGWKELSLGFYDDPITRQREVEHTGLAGGGPETIPPRVEKLRLGPGDGVYIPPLAFHWVHVEDELSIALSCAFATGATERDAFVHLFNRRARRLGPSLAPPGRSRRWDTARASAVRVGERLKTVRRRSR